MVVAYLSILPRTLIGFLTVGTTYFTNIILFTCNTLKQETYLPRWSPCFGFFGCFCYNRRTHNPMVEKPGAQNVTAYENQDNQYELSDHKK